MAIPTEGEGCPWPGQIAPRLLASRVLERWAEASAISATERDAILERAIAEHPGCHADMVRSHIEVARFLDGGEARRVARTERARAQIAQARALAAASNTHGRDQP